MKTYFYSIGQQRTTTIKIKRSQFICTLRCVQTIEQAKAFISQRSKENKTAAHNCWAYIIGDKGDIYHCSDAGEPSGTAGKPMLNMLQSHRMTNIAAVVTRYFGGVKLGVRGLIEAYAGSVEQTVNLRKLKKIVHTIRFKIEVSYEFNERLLSQINHYLIRIIDTAYSDKIAHIIEIEKDDSGIVNALLTEYQSQEKLIFKPILDNHS